MAYIQNAIADSLNNEVFEEVKRTMNDHALSDVYAAYSPKRYKRRMGLLNENIVGKVYGMKLEVEDVDQPNPLGDPPPTVDKDLIEVIETGVGYDYYSPGPRPFVTNTAADLEGSNAHVRALAKGLAARGIKTK